MGPELANIIVGQHFDREVRVKQILWLLNNPFAAPTDCPFK